MTEPSDTTPTPAAMPQQAPADEPDGSLELPENLEAAKKLRSENRNLRERLKAVEGEHEAATTRLAAMQHAEVERLASEHLVDPSDLWRVHPTHDEFVTEDGTINADLVAEAAAYLRARQVSSIELTRALLSRIENVDSRLHAYAAVTPKR